MNEDSIKSFSYEGNPITFHTGNGVMVNATQMAKTFGKLTKDFLNLQSTKEFLQVLSDGRNLLSADLVQVRKGGEPTAQGTWMHEDVAMEFARWLSPKFAIWCNDRIKKLLTAGVATISNDDEVIAQAMNVLQKRLESSKQRVQMLEGENAHLAEENRALLPRARYTDEVLQSTSTFTATQIAKEFGMAAVTFNKWLRDLGVLFRQSGQWMLTAKYQDRGLGEMRVARYIDTKTGEVRTSQSLVWTEKGRQFVSGLMAKKGGAR